MLYKRGKTWWFKFNYNGAEIRESARTRNKNVAAEVERKRHHDLERGVMSVPKPQKTPLFAAAAREWLDSKQNLAPRTRSGYAHSVKTLSQRFGKRLVCEISARDIERLQGDRRAAGSEGRGSTSRLVSCDRSCAAIASGRRSRMTCSTSRWQPTWVARSRAKTNSDCSTPSPEAARPRSCPSSSCRSTRDSGPGK